MAAESVGIDSERRLFKQLPTLLSGQLTARLLTDGGDEGYLSRQYPSDLLDTATLRLETPRRRSQLDFAPFSPMLRKARKRIGTLFSQLCDQSLIRRNHAKHSKGNQPRQYPGQQH